MADDIVARLRNWVLCDTPTEMVMLEAADEIERLRVQIDIAHNIIGSEAMIWLIVGANHPEAHLGAMRPAVNTYWKAYGNAFRKPDEEAHRG